MNSNFIHLLPEAQLLHAKFKTHNYPRHWHEEYTIGIMHQGTGSVRVKSNTEEYQVNSIALMNPGEINYGLAAKNGRLAYSMMYISGLRICINPLIVNTIS